MSVTRQPVLGRARVVIVQESLRQYRERFYTELRTLLDADGIELAVITGSAADAPGDLADLPWALHAPLRQVRVGGRRLVWQSCLPLLRGADLVVVEQASQMLLNYVLLARQLSGGTRVAMWGHGRNFSREDRSRPGEAVKRAVSRLPWWWFAYTERSADIVAAVGFPRERITVVRNSSDSRGLARDVDAISDEQRAATARRLGLRGNRVGLFLGALAPRKRLDDVIEAAREVRRRVPDFELVVAGGGPDAERVGRAAAEHPWIVAVGPAFGSELAELLRLAAVVMNPHWAGLVVVDAFAGGVPLVAASPGEHPPELDYVRSGENGLLVDAARDPAAFGAAVAKLLLDPPRLARLAAGARASREEFSAEEMAARFAGGLRDALARTDPVPLRPGAARRAGRGLRQ